MLLTLASPSFHLHPTEEGMGYHSASTNPTQHYHPGWLILYGRRASSRVRNSIDIIDLSPYQQCTPHLSLGLVFAFSAANGPFDVMLAVSK